MNDILFNLSNGMTYKGSCLYSELSNSDNENGDFYYTSDNLHYYMWNNNQWCDIGNGLGNVVSEEEFNTYKNNVNEEISEIKSDLGEESYNLVEKDMVGYGLYYNGSIYFDEQETYIVDVHIAKVENGKPIQ